MRHVAVIGVTGCGKSTVGALIADALGVPFGDGDHFHPRANIEKMTAGEPLTDEDRWPWLEDLGEWLAEHPDGAVIATSALKLSYRDKLREYAPELRVVHLSAPQHVLEERVRVRVKAEGHFAGPGLLDSQYEALEPPGAGERSVTIDVAEHRAGDAARAAVRSLREQ